jgi:hypothetical protein
MTWNSEGILCSGRELALLNLLTDNDVDIGIITKAQIPTSSHSDFNVVGYNSYLTHPSNLLKAAEYRVVTLVRSALATSAKIWLDLMHAPVQSVWIQLDIPQGTSRPGTHGPPGKRQKGKTTLNNVLELGGYSLQRKRTGTLESANGQ